MAGYSGTPLFKKLGIKAGHSVCLHSAPDGFESLLDGMPDQVKLEHGARGRGPHDVIVAFIQSQKALQSALASLLPKLRENGGFWIAWPKKSSGVVTDVTEDVVRAKALATGLVDNKVCAIDETWSGLRLVVRLADRKGTRTK